MTVQTSTSVATGIGNGVTTVFPVGYKFNDDSDLVVLRIDDATSAAETLTLNSDYTVQGAGNEAGGSVTMAAPLAVGKTLTITRIVDILQLTDLRNQGKFFAEVHEDSFDKFIMIMQQLFQAVGDSLQLNAARNRWDAKGRRIINVGDPVDAQDAVTKSWLEAYIAALLQTSIGPVQTAASVIIVAPNGDFFTLQDLADTSDPAKGAAIVGYSASLSYPPGTVGGDLLPKINNDMKIEPGNAQNLLIRSVTPNGPTRVHVEPNAHVDQGTVTKTDWMFDPYFDDIVNYRIINIFTKNGKGAGFNGQNGVAVVSAKGVGNHFGVFPTMNFGFSDDNANGVPMKLVYFDTADTEWRTPMIGAWRAARQDIEVGDHILSDYNIYVAATAGTTGATRPTHTSGTVSDGGVEWTFIRRYFNLTSFKPCVMIGDRDDMPKFGFPDARMQISKDTVVWNGQKIKFLDNTGAAVWEIGVDLNTDDFHIRSLTGGGSLRFDAAGSFVQNNGLSYLMNVKAAPDGATTVDVKGSELIGFGNTSATSVTAFTGQPYQRFFVQSSNGQTTLVHGANIKLAGAVDRVLGQDDVLQFVMNSSGSVAKQVL